MEEWWISMKEYGSFVRMPRQRIEASPLEFQDGVAFNDVFINRNPGQGVEGQGLWARIYLPQSPTHPFHLPCTTPPATKLPLILYFHGGGFVFCSVADSTFHPFHHRLAKAAQAVVVAVEYRLAPEHPLPAAYDDCLAALTWVQSQASAHAANHADADPWLCTYADFSRCYLMGDSAGGNIVYNLSLKLADMKVDPLVIKAHVLLHPFFGGVASTETEERMANDSAIPLSAVYWLWDQALPKGVDRDHPMSNPMSVPPSVYANAHIPKTLIAIANGDPIKERQMQYLARLKEAGVDVHVQFQDENHGFYLDGREKAACFIKDIANFFLHDC